MKVFYNDFEQGYQPRGSLFNGALVPYPDLAARTRNILQAISQDERFEIESTPPLESGALTTVHGEAFISAMEAVCGRLREDEELFPFLARPYPLLLGSPYPRIRIGYFAVDGSTPLIKTSHAVALAAAATAAAGAQALLQGERMTYSLPRPPGHHAGREFFAGYCLFNNAALAADLLTVLGKVAVLDVDFHHGNGTQDIFYERDDVLYVSIHGNPQECYPYIAGEAVETGSGKGAGLNINLPLAIGAAWEAYQPALEQALEKIHAFGPAALVVSAGFDTLESDPIGSFRLAITDMSAIGAMIAGLGLPLLVVQEGGYHVPSLGACVLELFSGLGLIAA